MKKVPICNLSSKAGLGNRIKGLFSFIRQYNPKEMYLVWPNKGWVSECFYDLFVFDYPLIIHECSQIKNIEQLELQSWRFYVNDKIDGISKYFSKVPLDINSCVFDLEYNRTPENMIKIYLPYFLALKPVKKIQDLINNVCIPPNTVAIQVRNNSDWEKGGRNTDIKKFISCMKKYPKNTLFYLSAMNEITSKKLKSVFINRIIELPNKDYNSMFHAVADLYLLAKCDRAIFSCGSTFAEVAWWLGGCTAKVQIVGEYTNWQEVKNKYIEKGLSHHHSFWWHLKHMKF